ncbi:MAG: tyrosine-type recombinase/integrase [Magnetococcales bacterium]|nr:tyrosine-type recombinase/integrase [Magnetococcales bacterium]
MKHISKKGERYYFNPSGTMRKHGYGSIPLGTDYHIARKKIEKLVEEWERIKNTGPDILEPVKGDFNWLIDRFQKDPTWYKAKAPRTREEMDYVFNILAEIIGTHRVLEFARRHGRAIYNKIRVEGSPHKGKKVIKWLVRLMTYSIEIGVRDDNPILDMELEATPGRKQVWKKEEVEAILEAMLNGGKAKSGNIIHPRPSIALATMIAYDSTLPQQDILALQWSQFDGEGLAVTLMKERAKKPVWVPLRKKTIKFIQEMVPKVSPYMIVSEANGQPYLDEQEDVNRSRCRIFSKLFRKFRERAGIQRQLTFHDLRRTAMSDLGNSGATNAEIVAFSGHSVSSPVLDVYVKPDHQAARRAAKKRDEPQE